MKRVITLSVLTAVMLTCTMALAVPGLINYQGRLTDSSGEYLNGTYSMRFDLYNSSSGSSSLWNETQNVNVNSGMYDVHLGSSATLPETLFAVNDSLYLQVSIRNSSGVYEALSPRQRLTSSPYALHAADADTLGGITPGSYSLASHLHDSRYYTQSQVNTYLSGKSDTTHTHDGRYYTKAQLDTSLGDKSDIGHTHSGSDITTGIIDLSGDSSSPTIRGANIHESGAGIFGGSTGIRGRGVYGIAFNEYDSDTDINYGGYFIGRASRGRGVYGEASKVGNVVNYGGYFLALGDQGVGVYGNASSSWSNNINYGGFFEAHGGQGSGVYAEATGTQGRGVYAEATGTNGRAVFGWAKNTGEVINYGGYFSAWGKFGRGVYGRGHGSEGMGVEGNGERWDFYASGPGVNYGPFTGAHEVLLAKDTPAEIIPGMIISVTGRVEARINDNKSISLSSTLPTATLSSKAMDKAVFGVLVSEMTLGEDHWYQSQEGERYGVVNALGEGRMLVCDVNGNIEAGDYITSSDIPGYGQLQNDDILRSYTVGKAIETVDWDAVTETVVFDGRQVKVYLIAVVYTSG